MIVLSSTAADSYYYNNSFVEVISIFLFIQYILYLIYLTYCDTERIDRVRRSRVGPPLQLGDNTRELAKTVFNSNQICEGFCGTDGSGRSYFVKKMGSDFNRKIQKLTKFFV